jgi:hypothetical protein
MQDHDVMSTPIFDELFSELIGADEQAEKAAAPPQEADADQ